MGIFKLNGIDYMGGGGGGNANEQVLTWAEYCALPEEEKANGTTYYIKDINGDGQEFQPIIYSTDEREIGVWTDGKPLYQKTINVGSIAAATASTTNHNISNLEKVISIVSTGFNTAEQKWNVIPRVDDAVAYQRGISVSDTQVIIQGPSQSQPLTNVNVTLLYTKTTDAAGSGTWTPQGVPTVHYSTEEQIVGTWTDGSTIYEKTITGTLGNTSQKTIDLSSEINCNLVIDIKGWIMSTDASNNYQIWMHDAYVRYYLRNNSLIIDKNGADNYGWDNPYTFIIRYTKTA